MPQEGDIRPVGGGKWEGYFQGSWQPMELLSPRAAAMLAAFVGLDANGDYVAVGGGTTSAAAVEGTLQAILSGPAVAKTTTAPPSTELLPPPRWPKPLPWPPMKKAWEKDAAGKLMKDAKGKYIPTTEVDEDAVAKGYKDYGNPYEKKPTRAEVEAAAAAEGPEFEAGWNDKEDKWEIQKKPPTREEERAKAEKVRLEAEQLTGKPHETFINAGGKYGVRPKTERGDFATLQEAGPTIAQREAETGKRYHGVRDPQTGRYTVEEMPEEPRAPIRFDEPAPIIFGSGAGPFDPLIAEALISGDNRRAVGLEKLGPRPSVLQLAEFAAQYSRPGDAQDFNTVFSALQDALDREYGGRGFQTNEAANQAARIVEQVARGERGPGQPLPRPPVFGGEAQLLGFPTPPGFMAGEDVSQFDIHEALVNPDYAAKWDAIFKAKREREAKSFAQNIGDLSQMTPQELQSKLGVLARPGLPGPIPENEPGFVPFGQQTTPGLWQEVPGGWLPGGPGKKAYVGPTFGVGPDNPTGEPEWLRVPNPTGVGTRRETPEERRRRLGLPPPSSFASTLAGFMGRPPLPRPRAPAVTRYR